jgi:hypothetical protein
VNDVYLLDTVAISCEDDGSVECYVTQTDDIYTSETREMEILMFMTRRNRSVALSYSQPSAPRAELDSHADTCCFGTDSALLLREYEQTVDVSPFLSSLGAEKNTPIADFALAYDNPQDYRTYILVYNQSLNFGHKMTG